MMHYRLHSVLAAVCEPGLGAELLCIFALSLTPLISSAAGPGELPGWPYAWSYSQFYWNITYFQLLWTDSFTASKWFDHPDNGRPWKQLKGDIADVFG